jgi:alpha-mannosidase
MRNSLSRRDLLKTSLLGGTGAVLLGPGALAQAWAAEAEKKVCVTLCNHWSYIGIGWNLGIESIALSATDAMEMADREPHVKTCMNFDARAVEFLAEKFPEVAERMKRYLAAGKVELIGGTYGQPMGTTVGGESNIRQLVVGRELIRKTLGYEVATFLEEEEFSHPQVPQIAAGAGYQYTSLAQVDTWGRAGVPVLDYNAILWKGVDGSALPCMPKNSLFRAGLDGNLSDTPAFKKLQALGVPLVFAWEEFGWDDPERPAYQYAPVAYQNFANFYPTEFVTVREYLDKYGAAPEESICLPMDAWDKSLTWGIGGDQVRILDRKVEKLLLAAELYDAVAAGLGAKSQAELLEKAWKDLLTSQSHDVGLCEYSRWQGRLAPLDRIEDKHNLSWGAIGYIHLDAAQKQGQESLDAALKSLAGKINSEEKKQGQLAATVFNPHDKDRTEMVLTGRVYPLPENTKAIVVKDHTGRTLPSQVVKSESDRDGNLIVAELAFSAANVPAAGYDTYYLEPTAEKQSAAKTGFSYDESKFLLENEFLRVRLDPKTGAVASLIHKAAGRETIDEKRGAFPHFVGTPNPNLSLRPQPPGRYDSATSQARLDWFAKGPMYATVRARHGWKYLGYETRVTLAAGCPYVEVVTRVFAQVPPLFNGSGDQLPSLTDTNLGYWLSFAPAFEVAKVVRDYPLAVDTTEKNAFHALTFVDLLGKDMGLMVLHPGTQWFLRDKEGIVSNLVMREWESNFDTKEYGWPLYSEYRHALMPHAAVELNNAARLRASLDFTQPLLCRIGQPHAGDLPPSKSFLRVTPETVMLSAFRRKSSNSYELRVVETEGKTADARFEIALPVADAVETNLLGRKIGEVSHGENKLSFPVDPWKIRTFEAT